MSSRLASFKGPSTPTSSPVRARQAEAPASPSRQTESTFHRRLRTHLQELRSISETWDDLVLVDGLKAAKALVDLRTDLDNEIALAPDKKPRGFIVGPKLALMEQRIEDLDAVLVKLQKQFKKMNSVVDNLEGLLIEAHQAKGWKWVSEEPMWMTWTLEKFVTTVPNLLPHYHRSLDMHTKLVAQLHPHSVTFQQSREAISQWEDQPFLQGHSWDDEWEDICEVEIERWNK